MKKYLLTTIIATLSALIVWYVVPKEYSAVTAISDEFSEMMLEVGLDRIEAMIKDKTNAVNEGINNIETYCSILKSRDFARRLSAVALPNGDSYGLYLGKKDTIKGILDNINYNINYRQQTLKIQFSDRNADIAAMMLKTVLAELQTVIDEANHNRDEAMIRFYQEKRDSAYSQMMEAADAYNSYVDSHRKLFLKKEQTRAQELASDLSLYRKQYLAAEEDCVRHKMLTERPYTSFVVLKEVTTPTDDNSHPVGYILCFNVLALAFVKGRNLWRKNRTTFFEDFDWGNVFAPWNVTICIWALILFLLAVDTELDPLSTQFWVSLCLWLTIFLPVSIIACNLVKPSEPAIHSNCIEINQLWFNFFFVIAIIITPLYAYQVYRIISMFNLEDVMKGVRNLALFGDGYGLLNYAYVFDLALLIVGLWRYPKIPFWQLAAIIVMWLIYATCNMAKGQFFVLFVSAIYVLFERKVIKIRTIVIVGAVLLILFYLFNLAREDDEYRDNESFLDFIGMYVLSSSVAYGKLMEGITEHFGENVFWVVYYYGNKLFGTVEVSHIQLQDFVNVPVLTNVYTIFRPYFVDFGQMGVAMAAFVFGLVSGVTYRFARYGYPFGICLYTYLIFILVLQFFDDQVLEGTGVLMQFLLIMYLIVQRKFSFSFMPRHKELVQ